MTNAILLSATYQYQRAMLKFYDPLEDKLIFWYDNSGHLPHCYVNYDVAQKIREMPGIQSLQQVEIMDVVKSEKRSIIKVTTNDPLIIGGRDDSLREMYQLYESDIKYYQTYLYDRGFIVGKWYNIEDKQIIPINQTDNQINTSNINIESVIEVDKFKKQFMQWASLLDEPIPNIRRLAFDIEVETSMGILPDPLQAPERITAISFHSDDLQKVFVLKRPEIKMGEEQLECDIKWFESEKEMIEEAMEIIASYPMVLTYNGDIFDMPYMHNRANKLGIEKTPFKMMAKNATLYKGIHIDMYGVFSNKSLKIYAFKSQYVDDSLNSVSEALLKEHKTEYEGNLNDIPLLLLAKYCYNDARLTYRLSSYNNNLVINLLVILCRIANMPIDDVSRMTISHWIKSMLYFNHRQNNELIPRNDEFPKAEASTKAVIEDKKYQGAIVWEPQKGIHFDVTVMDFASLYPSIIKTKNISYETVRCPHIECQSNIIPQTNHWCCTKRSGVVSLLIGSLKELRVGHFKKLSKQAEGEKKQQYETISEALKVFLNASYGVIGFESFPLYYLPTAEAVTAYGRQIIMDNVQRAKELGMTVLYGDTDSIFLKKPSEEQKTGLMNYARTAFNIDLEQDKEYRYVILSNLKKNYFGIKKDGSADIKGLTGKKSHTPPFIKSLFTNVVDELKKIEILEQFEPTKKVIIDRIKTIVKNIDQVPIEEMAFRVKLNNDPSEYKSKTQSMKAAALLGKKLQKGQFITFVKTWTEPGAKPIEIVQRKEIDIPKYLETLETTMQQITDSLDIDFDLLMGRGRKTRLEEFL